MSLFLFIFACLGLFMAGSVFESGVIRGEGMFDGAIPPALTAVITLFAFMGWASLAFDAATH